MTNKAAGSGLVRKLLKSSKYSSSEKHPAYIDEESCIKIHPTSVNGDYPISSCYSKNPAPQLWYF